MMSDSVGRFTSPTCGTRIFSITTTSTTRDATTLTPSERVLSLDPVLVKGLEFDLVVLVDSERWGEGLIGAVDRYVAMTRATQRLVVLNG